jgi:hypothetical protein
MRTTSSVRHWLAYPVIALSGGLAGAFLVTRPPAVTASATIQPADPERGAEAVLARLQRRVAQLEAEPKPNVAASRVQRTEAPAQDEPEPASLEDLEEQSAARREDFALAYQRESRDPSWAAASERELARRLGDAGIQVLEVACARTMCRAEVTPGEDVMDRVAVLTLTQRTSSFSSLRMQADGEGPPHALYALRRGFAFPESR